MSANSFVSIESGEKDSSPVNVVRPSRVRQVRKAIQVSTLTVVREVEEMKGQIEE